MSATVDAVFACDYRGQPYRGRVGPNEREVPAVRAPDGSLIAGRQVQLNLSGALLNGGTIAGRELVLIDAQGIQSSGRIRSEGVTALRTQDDIDVRGGELSARDALLLDAGRDLKVSSTTAHSADGTDGTDGQTEVLDRAASTAGGGFVAGAYVADRLAADGRRQPVVFEASHRIGGRLWSQAVLSHGSGFCRSIPQRPWPAFPS